MRLPGAARANLLIARAIFATRSLFDRPEMKGIKTARRPAGASGLQRLFDRPEMKGIKTVLHPGSIARIMCLFDRPEMKGIKTGG